MSTATAVGPTPEIDRRVEIIDWTRVSAVLDGHGWAMIDKTLTVDGCRSVATLYDDANRFGRHVVMARHGFGRGRVQV